MKVELIKEAVALNPDFDPDKPKSTTNRKYRMLPVGTMIEDPEAWLLCLDSRIPDMQDNSKTVVHAAKAKPIDDEAVQKVEYEKAQQERKYKLARKGKITLPEAKSETKPKK
jgi:hypothetical protein